MAKIDGIYYGRNPLNTSGGFSLNPNSSKPAPREYFHTGSAITPSLDAASFMKLGSEITSIHENRGYYPDFRFENGLPPQVYGVLEKLAEFNPIVTAAFAKHYGDTRVLPATPIEVLLYSVGSESCVLRKKSCNDPIIEFLEWQKQNGGAQNAESAPKKTEAEKPSDSHLRIYPVFTRELKNIDLHYGGKNYHLFSREDPEPKNSKRPHAR